MVGDKRVLWPQAEAFDRPRRPVTGEGFTDLQSKTVAFVDNGRPNADVVMESLNDLMISKYEIKPMTVSKRHLGMRNNEPLPKSLFDDLLKRVDAAVTGLGSWGSCTARSVRDTADFLDNGVPSVVIVAPAFERQALAFAEIVNLPPEGVIVLPIGQMSPDARETISKIREVAPECLALVEQGLKPAAGLDVQQL